MPFDAAAPPPNPSSPAAAIGRSLEGGLTLGVFSHAGRWKVYSPFDRACAYPNRAEALAAAEARARQAARDGMSVEVFVEEEDGALRQASIERH